jgi:hypothetical protein
MKSAIAKKEIELRLTDRFGDIFQRREKQPAEIVPTGVGEIDSRLNGFPRGAITEIHGAASSGRTSLLLSSLAIATRQEETCALVDTSDTFDLSSAASARVDYDRLLWVRCSGSVERAFKATDLLLQSGGFGLVVLNLADIAAKHTRRIITSWWFRFRRTIENTPTVLVVVTPVSCTRSCAALVLEVKSESPVWPNAASFVLANQGGKLAKEESHSSARLFLVPEVTRSPGSPLSEGRAFGHDSYALPLSHAHLLESISIQVNQERPVSWIAGPVRFKTSLH